MRLEQYHEITVEQALRRALMDARSIDSVARFLRTHLEVDREEPVSQLIRSIRQHPANISDGISSHTRDKQRLIERLRKLLQYLNESAAAGLDEKTIIAFEVIYDKPERLVELLKYLQSGGKTREEVAVNFGVTVETLRDDLRTLEDGYELLGQRMQIKLDRDTFTYDSTIHPIFLPLNLTEIAALTIGLKMKEKTDPVFGEIYADLADGIHSQLSPYAQAALEPLARENNLLFFRQSGDYRSEADYFSEILPEKRRSRLAYLWKSGQPCEVTYVDQSGQTASISGHIDPAQVADHSFKEIVFRDRDNGIIRIPSSRLVEIRPIKRS